MKTREEIAERLCEIDVQTRDSTPWSLQTEQQASAYLAQADYVLGLLGEARMPSEEKIAKMAMDLFGWTHVDGNWQNLIPHVRIFLHGVKNSVTPNLPANALTEDEEAFWDKTFLAAISHGSLTIESSAKFADGAVALRRRVFSEGIPDNLIKAAADLDR
jgi:hypothetical protein